MIRVAGKRVQDSAWKKEKGSGILGRMCKGRKGKTETLYSGAWGNFCECESDTINLK